LVSQAIRYALIQEIPIDVTQMDKALSSVWGELILSQFSQVLGARSASIPALRASLLLSAAKGNSLTLMEVIKNYPLEQIEVDTEKLESLTGLIKRFIGG